MEIKNIEYKNLVLAKNDNINFFAVKEFDKIDFFSKVKSWFNV